MSSARSFKYNLMILLKYFCFFNKTFYKIGDPRAESSRVAEVNWPFVDSSQNPQNASFTINLTRSSSVSIRLVRCHHNVLSSELVRYAKFQRTGTVSKRVCNVCF